MKRTPPAGLRSLAIDLLSSDSEGDPTMADPLPREEEQALRLGRYTIRGLLGRGGMGVVFRVKDEVLERELAAKVAPDGAPHPALEKFVQEAKVTGQLEHPNIVPVHELGTTADGRLYFTMKRVAGKTLHDLLHDPTVPEAPLTGLLSIFLKVCDAIRFAHSRNFIHRDLKPSNIMVGEFGEVLVLDWGLVKALAEKSADTPGGEVPPMPLPPEMGTLATQEGSVLGTPHYMPPEQARGEIDRLDARSDVYSLGTILYEILCRRMPVEGTSRLEVLDRVERGQWTPPSIRAPDRRIPWELDAVVQKAMARRQPDRYASVAELAADVERFLSGQALRAASYGPGRLLLRWARRRWRLLTIGALGMAVFGLAGSWVWTERQGALGRAREIGVHRSDARRAMDSGDWSGALGACERGLALATDPELSRWAELCRDRIEGVSLENARRKFAEERLVPLSWRIQKTHPLLSIDWFPIQGHLRSLEADLAGIEEIAGKPLLAGDPAPWALLGQGWYFVGDDLRADLALRRAAELGSTDPAVPFHRALVALERAHTARVTPREIGTQGAPLGWIDEARLELARVRALRVDELAVPLELVGASQALAEGDPERARTICEEALRSPRQSLDVAELYLLLARASEGEAALEALELALRFRPHFARALFLRGNLRWASGDLQGATGDFGAALELAPRFVPAWVHRGTARRGAGDLEGALQDLDSAVAIEPGNALALLNRGNTHLALGRPQAALEDYDRSLALAPGWPRALANRAGARAALKDFEGAVADYRAALASDIDPDRLPPDSWRIWWELARTLWRMSRGGEAEIAFMEAVRLAPERERASVEAELAVLRGGG